MSSHEAPDVERALARYYDQEADERAGRELRGERVAFRAEFLASLRGDERLLEIGTGPGRDAEAFVDHGVTAIGVDLSAAFAEHATGVGAHVALASARTLPFGAASFDVIWTMSTLMHIPDSAIDGALGELRRVLRPGGRAAVGVWGGADVEDHLTGRHDPPRLFSRRSDQRWVSMLGAIGDVEHFTTWTDGEDPFHYQLAILRRT